MTVEALYLAIYQYKEALLYVGAILVFVVAPAIYVLPIDESAWGKKPTAKKPRGPVTYCRQHNKARSDCEDEHRP
jgi:hypothetical protein